MCPVIEQFLNFNNLLQELLALGEQIGSVGTGLSEEFIQKNLKIRTFASSAACVNVEDETSLKKQMNFCVICQVCLLIPY